VEPRRERAMDIDRELEREEEERISGGARSMGYCPYTEDRNYRNERVGNFDPTNEECADCGWRAWSLVLASGEAVATVQSPPFRDRVCATDCLSDAGHRKSSW
jgi:hypothetical protein